MGLAGGQRTCAESMGGTSEEDEEGDGDGQVGEVEGRHVVLIEG